MKEEKKAPAFLKNKLVKNLICLVLILTVAGITGWEFYRFRTYREEIKAPDGTEIQHLSDYLPSLKGTAGDTEIYVFRGEQDGGSMLVMGGTHADELAGHLSAIIMVENLKVTRGTVYVIPRANNSGFTNNFPQEASPMYIEIPTANGTRTVVYGSRATNPVDQWPDPDLYTHYPSGQGLSGAETRNLNRSYPGRENGNFTERVACAIRNFINTNAIDLTIDLHEASPEYPNINSSVLHERAMKLSGDASLELDDLGISMRMEVSPVNLHGLTHRELGDYTNTLALLMETANPCQGRIRGATNAELALMGKDPCYVKASELGYLYIPYDENGVAVEERCGRHLQAIQVYAEALGWVFGDEYTIEMTGLPQYNDLISASVGDWLK
ncbi:MAG: succinylglutamate desuccinylase/aspartoacylase family protein [Lachnospiraceae bacterium]|nr:succinylglutamate desuccinylase/aspartoacylase family protein [Lachnospiraceae bacterium]